MNRSTQKARVRAPSKTFFAIIFEGRTGTSYIVSCLNSHPQALCYPEILQDLSARDQRRALQLLVSGEPVEGLSPQAIHPAYYHGPLISKTGLSAVGFKTKLSDVADVKWLGTMLAGWGFGLIYLKRRNIVKAVISELNVDRLRKRFGMGVSNARSAEQILGPMHVDLGQLVRKLRRRIRREEDHEAFYQRHEGARIRLYYEDLLRDQAGFFAKLLDFLQLENLPMNGRFEKGVSDNLQEAIQNYRQVKRLLAGTHFEQLLGER